MLDRARSGRKVKVFMNGRSRAVRIPKEFDFPGDEVVMRKEEDGTLTLEPVRVRRSPRELVEWLRGSAAFERGSRRDQGLLAGAD